MMYQNIPRLHGVHKAFVLDEEDVDADGVADGVVDGVVEEVVGEVVEAVDADCAVHLPHNIGQKLNLNQLLFKRPAQ